MPAIALLDSVSELDGASRKVSDMYMPGDGGSRGRDPFDAPVVRGRVLGRRPPFFPPSPTKNGNQQQVNPSPPNIE
ncbi:uncharacterized protein A4U43_C05F27590 [Asparagus officinalis]|uniref:Uncharacterized protein n=1 Tax=Asparagus officinalis TaxID=4686 RepID=A0A5P1EUY0_ASPOF|nr:uncharacterized protein A4U43_C05F27590 [Asparagus officinalis]